jgi:hypothetical protein
MEKSANGFPQRHNADGSYDSICPRCFLTVARHMTRLEIEIEERNHVCTEMDLNIARVARDAIRNGL